MRLHSHLYQGALGSVVVCGQAICDYTRAIKRQGAIGVVVCGQAICDYTTDVAVTRNAWLWFAVRLYAITLRDGIRKQVSQLWFAVRLYAITLITQFNTIRGVLWFAVRLYAITLALT